MLAAVALLSAPAAGQVGDVDDWCIQRYWCNGPSHLVVSVVAAQTAAELTPLEIEEARWIPVAFYVGKEIRDHIRWDDLSWGDTAVDLGFTALSVPVNKAVNDWLFGGGR